MIMMGLKQYKKNIEVGVKMEYKISEINGSKVIITNGKIYAVCVKCKKLVRLNKPIFNDLHICD